MSLNQKIASFLARTDSKPARSKLEPYADLIRTLRQRRWTYIEIARALRDEFAVEVHPTTIHAFVKVRANQRRTPAIPPPTASVTLPPPEAKKPRFNLDA